MTQGNLDDTNRDIDTGKKIAVSDAVPAQALPVSDSTASQSSAVGGTQTVAPAAAAQVAPSGGGTGTPGPGTGAPPLANNEPEGPSFTAQSSRRSARRDARWIPLQAATLELCNAVFAPPASLTSIYNSTDRDWLTGMSRVIRICGEPGSGRTFTAYWLAMKLLLARMAGSNLKDLVGRIHYADRGTTDEALQALLELPPEENDQTSTYVVFEDAGGTDHRDILHEDRIQRLNGALHNTAQVILIGSASGAAGVREFSTRDVQIREALARHVAYERQTGWYQTRPGVLAAIEKLFEKNELNWLIRAPEVWAFLWRMNEVATADDLHQRLPQIRSDFQRAAVTLQWYLRHLSVQARLMALMVVAFPWLDRQETEAHLVRLAPHENFGESRAKAYLEVRGRYLRFTHPAFEAEVRRQLENDYILLLSLVGESAQAVFARVRACLGEDQAQNKEVERVGALLGRLCVHQLQWLEGALEIALNGEYPKSRGVALASKALEAACELDPVHVEWASATVRTWAAKAKNRNFPAHARAIWAGLATMASIRISPANLKRLALTAMRAFLSIPQGLGADEGEKAFDETKERFNELIAAADNCASRHPQWVARQLRRHGARVSAALSRRAVAKLKSGQWDEKPNRSDRIALLARMARDAACALVSRRENQLPPQAELTAMLDLLPVLLDDSPARTHETLDVVRRWLADERATPADRDQIVQCLLDACDVDEKAAKWMNDELLGTWLIDPKEAVSAAAARVIARVRALHGAPFDLPGIRAAALLYAPPARRSERQSAAVVVTAVARALRQQIDLLLAPLGVRQEPSQWSVERHVRDVMDLPDAVPVLVPVLSEIDKQNPNLTVAYILSWQTPPDISDINSLGLTVPVEGVITNAAQVETSIRWQLQRIFDPLGAALEQLASDHQLYTLMTKALDDIDRHLFVRLVERTGDQWWEKLQAAGLVSALANGSDTARAAAALSAAEAVVPANGVSNGIAHQNEDAIRKAVCCFLAAYRFDAAQAAAGLSGWLDGESKIRLSAGRIAATRVMMVAAHEAQSHTLATVLPLLPKLARLGAGRAVANILGRLRAGVDATNDLPALAQLSEALMATVPLLPRQIFSTRSVMEHLWRIAVPSQAKPVKPRPARIREMAFQAMCALERARFSEHQTPFALLAEASAPLTRLVVIVVNLDMRNMKLATSVADVIAKWFNQMSSHPSPGQGVLLFVAGHDGPIAVDGQQIATSAIVDAAATREGKPAGNEIPRMVLSIPAALCRLRVSLGTRAFSENTTAYLRGRDVELLERVDPHSPPPQDLMRRLLTESR